MCDGIGDLGTKRSVQDGAPFSLVDLISREHRLNSSRHIRLLRKLRQKFKRRAIEVIFRIIERQVARFEREFLSPLLIARKQVA